jgi:hypothetical protein
MSAPANPIEQLDRDCFWRGGAVDGGASVPGQTTNIRTPGGGFAPAYSTVDASGHAPRHAVGEPATHAATAT